MPFNFGFEVNVNCPVIVIFAEIVILLSCSLIGSYVTGGERQSPTICKEVRPGHGKSIDSYPQINYTADGQSLVLFASFNVSSKCWIPSGGPGNHTYELLWIYEIGFKLGSNDLHLPKTRSKNLKIGGPWRSRFHLQIIMLFFQFQFSRSGAV